MVFGLGLAAIEAGRVNSRSLLGTSVKGVKVQRRRAEELRAALARRGFVDKGHAIVEDGDDVVIPLVGSPEGDLTDAFEAVLVEADFPKRKARADPIDDIRASANVPEHLRRLLPDKWELFGDVLVLRLDPGLDRYEAEAARAYADVLGAKTVLRDVGGITGELREPVTKTLLGSDTVTVHKENGVIYKFDAARIMFSSGNMEERIRMAGVRCDGETVVDMFAGIGYFSLPLAVHQRPRKIIACELNPVSHAYLVENIGLNKVERVVEPILGDNRDLAGDGVADRVIMGYVKTTHEFLPTALRLLRDGGFIHYHETCPNDLLPARPLKRVVDAAAGRSVRVLRFKEIKSYAPGVSHVVVDAQVVRDA